MQHLTARQVRIIDLIADVSSTHQAAKILGISDCAIKHHLRLIYLILGIESGQKSKRIRLATNWRCELYQIGLKELGAI